MQLSVLSPLPLNRRLTDVVYETLRDAIVQSKILPGTPLSVPGLAQQLKVSRSPVREAVLQLASVGLAVDTPRRGVVVAQLTRHDLLDVHDMREVLEGLSARLAAERRTEVDVALLREILDRQAEAVSQQSANQYAATNQEFHSRIARIGGNERLQRALGLLYDQARLVVSTAAVDPVHAETGFREHQSILQAIALGDSVAASAVMLAHMQRTRPQPEVDEQAKTSRRGSEKRSEVDNVDSQKAGIDAFRRGDGSRGGATFGSRSRVPR